MALIAPQVVDEGGSNYVAQIDKSNQANSPDYFVLWYSTTGIGTPDSNPGDWTFLRNSDADDGGTYWVSDDTFYMGTFGIAAYVYLGVQSPWSDVVPLV
jgi:hypothetical protein